MMKKVLIALSILIANSSSAITTTKEVKSEDQVQNVIFMIGDGMGLAQASMLMIDKGYQSTAFDRADNIALIKTYSANNRVTDSAAAGTALACGEKTNNGTLGLTANLDTLYSIATKAKNIGMSTGLVAACAIQHATPAAFYAHVSSRKEDHLITQQLAASNVDIAIGGGAKSFDNEVNGKKLLDIATENGFNIARNFDELSQIEDGRVLGLFAPKHVPSMIEGRGDFLERATIDALSRLSKNKNGFFLMVEGSQIDWTCHDNDADGTLAEVADFEKCVDIAMDFADNNPGTLVVITADHETGGLSMVSGDSDFTKAESGIEYKYSTVGHSGILVPVYVYGAGAEKINGVMENTQLSRKIMESLGL